MHPTARSEARTAHGFTLVECVVVIAITGVLASVVSLFIVKPVQAYLATSARAVVVDQADLALRRVGRDLRIALAGSVRVTGSGLALELIPTRGGARYATQGSGALDFGIVDTAFDLIGPGLDLAAAQQLVFYNLGAGVIGSDAYAANGSAAEQVLSNRRSASNGTGIATSIGMVSVAGLPAANFAAPYRVLAVDAPVSYRCDLGAGTLSRYSGYGFVATQPDPPVGGTVAVLASGVTACRFSADGTLVAARAALAELALTLSTDTGFGTETVSLYQAVYVDNLP